MKSGELLVILKTFIVKSGFIRWRGFAIRA
jgi:hypothetical protein